MVSAYHPGAVAGKPIKEGTGLLSRANSAKFHDSVFITWETLPTFETFRNAGCRTREGSGRYAGRCSRPAPRGPNSPKLPLRRPPLCPAAQRYLRGARPDTQTHSSRGTLPRSSLSIELVLPVHTRARRLGRLTRYAGLPSSTRKPMDRRSFAGGVMSCRMASNNVRMLSSCPAIFRSSAESFVPSSVCSASVARSRTNARMIAMLT